MPSLNLLKNAETAQEHRALLANFNQIDLDVTAAFIQESATSWADVQRG